MNFDTPTHKSDSTGCNGPCFRGRVMLTRPVACLTNILSLSKTKTHGSPLPPPSSAHPDAAAHPVTSITDTQGRAAKAAAVLTDRRPVDVGGRVVCSSGISWLLLLCGSSILVISLLFAAILFCYLKALTLASMRLKGWQCLLASLFKNFWFLHEIWCRHSWCPDDESYWLCWVSLSGSHVFIPVNSDSFLCEFSVLAWFTFLTCTNLWCFITNIRVHGVCKDVYVCECDG